MTPTKFSNLLKLFLVTAWLMGALVHILREQFQVFIQVPLNLPIALLSLMVAISSWTVLAKNRISGPAKTFTPLQSARTAALALAGSRTGSLLAGGGAGTLISYLFAPPTAANTDRIQVLAATVLTGLLLAAISLLLERICLVPDKKDDK